MNYLLSGLSLFIAYVIMHMFISFVFFRKSIYKKQINKYFNLGYFILLLLFILGALSLGMPQNQNHDNVPHMKHKQSINKKESENLPEKISSEIKKDALEDQKKSSENYDNFRKNMIEN